MPGCLVVCQLARRDVVELRADCFWAHPVISTLFATRCSLLWSTLWICVNICLWFVLNFGYQNKLKLKRLVKISSKWAHVCTIIRQTGIPMRKLEVYEISSKELGSKCLVQIYGCLLVALAVCHKLRTHGCADCILCCQQRTITM